MLHRTPIIVLTLFFVFGTSQAFGENANDEIMASFSKLEKLKSYRIKTTMTPSSQFAQQMEMAKQLGMDMEKLMLQEVINPNLRKIIMEVPVVSTPGMPSVANMQDMKNMPQNVPPMGSVQMKAYRMKMYGVSNGSGFATYLDCPECQQAIDDAMRQQMREYLKNLTLSLVTSVEGGPTALITLAMISAAEIPIEKKILEKEEEGARLNQWKCRDAKVERSDKTSSPNLMNAKATGKAMVGAEEAKSYVFSVVDENSRKEMPMTLCVSASSGLPLKIAMSQPQGTMIMEYYDFNAPVTIDLPDCMKK
jgi:hypothetical protein